MKREYHLTERIAYNMAYEIAMQYKENLTASNDYGIWKVNLICWETGGEIYISFSYSVNITYFDNYKRKYIKKRLKIKISEQSKDGNFAINVKKENR